MQSHLFECKTFINMVFFKHTLVTLCRFYSRILTVPCPKSIVKKSARNIREPTFHRLTRPRRAFDVPLRLEAVYACERQRPEPSLTARRVGSPHGPREQPVPAGRTRCVPIRAISDGRPSAFGVCLTHTCKLEFYVLMRESRRWRHEVQRE